MPHGNLEVLIGGDPRLGDVGLFLEVIEPVYEQLCVIYQSEGIPRTELLRRLRAPARFISAGDRLHLRLVEQTSVLLIFGGFLLALTALGALLAVVERFTKIRKDVAQKRKADAEKWYLEESAKKISVDRALSIQKLAERMERAARLPNLQAWVDAINAANGESERLGLAVDARPTQDYQKVLEEATARLRKAGLRQTEIRKEIQETLRPVAKLKSIEIIRIELK